MAGARDSSATNQNRRVKVYVLGSDGQWDDRGTGYVNCELIADYDALGLRVISEQEANKELLVTKIFEEEVFQRQGDTIVTWTNPETREDVALSFQEATGAQEVWEMICQVQGRSPLDDGGDDTGGGGNGHFSDSAGSDLKLPQPDMENLQQLQDIVVNATSATRDRIVDGVMVDGYLAKLLSIFRDCEDLEMTSQPLHPSILLQPRVRGSTQFFYAETLCKRVAFADMRAARHADFLMFWWMAAQKLIAYPVPDFQGTHHVERALAHRSLSIRCLFPRYYGVCLYLCLCLRVSRPTDRLKDSGSGSTHAQAPPLRPFLLDLDVSLLSVFLGCCLALAPMFASPLPARLRFLSGVRVCGR